MQYQEVLKRAKDLRAVGNDVAVELVPEPDNPKDSKAIAFLCFVNGNWHRIGYVVKECLEDVHMALAKQHVISVHFAWIKYTAEWTRLSMYESGHFAFSFCSPAVDPQGTR